MIRHRFLFSFFPAICIFLALGFSGKQFHLWSQIRHAYWGAEWFTAETLRHPEEAPDPASPSTPLDQWVQLPRVALLYPVVRGAAALGLPADTVFTACSWLLILLIGWTLQAALPLAPVSVPRQWLVPTLWYAVGGIAFAMNGRMLFSLLSAALVTRSITRPHSGWRMQALILTTALWLASVSSGVLTVAWCAIAYLTWAMKTRSFRMACLPGLILLGGFVGPGIVKNFLYFHERPEGVIRGLLGHGYGVLLTHPIPLLLFILVVLIAAWKRPRFVPQSLPRPIGGLLGIALGGAVFGRATLSFALPPLLLLIVQGMRERLAARLSPVRRRS